MDDHTCQCGGNPALYCPACLGDEATQEIFHDSSAPDLPNPLQQLRETDPEIAQQFLQHGIDIRGLPPIIPLWDEIDLDTDQDI